MKMAAAYAVAAAGFLGRSSTLGFSALSTRTISRFATRASSKLLSNSDSGSAVTEDGSRISRGDVDGLDLRAVTDRGDMVMSHLISRRASEETMKAAGEIATLNERRKELILSRDSALSIRKEQSALVGQLMRNRSKDNDDSDSDKTAVEEAKAKSSAATADAAEAESELSDVESRMNGLLANLPNLLDDSVPDGKDENDNEEVERWGSIDDLPKELGWTDEGDFQPLWHDDVAMGLDGWKVDNAVQMSGSRFVALSGHVARLERAISSFLLDMHTETNGYTEVSVPYVVGRSALEGTAQLPKFEEDLFRINPESHTCNGEDAFLIPTAEVPLTNMHRDTILEHDALPISYVALTPCFRAEAGSYGRDTRGLIRTHQFHKVEMVKISAADDSDNQHELLTRHAQGCLEALKLPYRKVRLCSGDIGFSARQCYDLEVWLPGSKEYREISSCSNTGDFQARRMALRYRPKQEVSPTNDDTTDTKDANKKKKKQKKPKPQFCHTINGSGLAIGRTLLAVLENYQMPDGSVTVPDVLRPYMGGMEILKLP